MPKPTSKKARRSRPGSRVAAALWNVLTILVLFSLLLVSGLFLLIFIDPQTGLNPFPPPVAPQFAVLPTLGPTDTPLPTPTWTATYTPEPTATYTPRPTATLPPTATFFSLITPSNTPTATVPVQGYSFEIQQGSPVAIANIYHPELGCNWMGVGGQALDLSGGPMTGLVIRLGGTLQGRPMPDSMSLTGVEVNYGRAGYEFTLADKPIKSQNTLWLQLLNQAGVPLSEKVYFDTYEDCNRNLIVINFKQVRP